MFAAKAGELLKQTITIMSTSIRLREGLRRDR